MSGGWTDLALCLALGVGLAACAGLRAWLPLLMAGAAARLGWLELGPHFEFLAGNRALIIFGLASVVEIAADKVPALDHLLDVVSTVLRPAAGSLLAASVLWPVHDPLVAVCLGVAVGAPTALLPHAAKSLTRAASTALTAGLANPLLSVLEDVGTFVLFFLVILVPLMSLLLVLAFALFLVLRRRRRAAASPVAA
jgi:hypothetical protein